MTDQKKPETLTEAELDIAGGGRHFDEAVIELRRSGAAPVSDEAVIELRRNGTTY